MISEMFREFFKDKMRIAVMFLLCMLLCLGMWLYLEDDGALVAGILCGGISVHQFYKFYLQKRSQR